MDKKTIVENYYFAFDRKKRADKWFEDARLESEEANRAFALAKDSLREMERGEGFVNNLRLI